MPWEFPVEKTVLHCSMLSVALDASTENWIQGEHTYKYKNGVNVLFADAASEEVTLEGVLTPASVCVNNSKGTTLTWLGSGSLSGDMMLTKQVMFWRE